jgi:hypothetical protein
LGLSQNIFDNLLRNQIFQDLLHKGCVKTRETSVDCILPVPVKEARPCIRVHRSADEKIAYTPTNGSDDWIRRKKKR